MNINYDHTLNPHRTIDGEIVVPLLFAHHIPKSLLDVGCGTGTWTRAAFDHGVKDILGIDGNSLSPDALISSANFQVVDLSGSWDLNRRFELVLCLEVAEHLNESCADILIESLARHSDWIVFSAACPGQAGQHHVNCQWPEYWQRRFNSVGFACADSIRSVIWDDQRIAPWYRQNIFVAKRDQALAGNEPRIHSLLHPEIMGLTQHCATIEDYMKLIETGVLPWQWYVLVPLKSLWRKIMKRLFHKK